MVSLGIDRQVGDPLAVSAGHRIDPGQAGDDLFRPAIGSHSCKPEPMRKKRWAPVPPAHVAMLPSVRLYTSLRSETRSTLNTAPLVLAATRVLWSMATYCPSGEKPTMK